MYLVLKKHSSIRLQVSCCRSHQVYTIYDLKKQKTYTIFYQFKNILSCVCQKQFKFHFIFLSNNLFWCLQPPVNSFLLFNKRLSSIISMTYNFSRRHFVIIYFCIAVNFFNNRHFTIGFIPLSFKSHMYLDSSVLLEYVLCLKSLVWFPNRSLNGVSVNPK